MTTKYALKLSSPPLSWKGSFTAANEEAMGNLNSCTLSSEEIEVLKDDVCTGFSNLADLENKSKS